MKKRVSKATTVISGLALFSMFFGAGNIIFPLSLGLETMGNNGAALVGMIFTAILLPVLGVVAMALFNGDYKAFFFRLGKIPGGGLLFLSLILIGPFVGIPRTIAVSHGIVDFLFGGNVVSLAVFSLVSCLLVLWVALYKDRLVSYVGGILTPLMLFALLVLIVIGFQSGSSIEKADVSMSYAFLKGIVEGYNTLDLVAALFFSGLILDYLRNNAPGLLKKNTSYLAFSVLKAGFIGGGILAFVYIGMSYVIVFHAEHPGIAFAAKEQLLAGVSVAVLGEVAGIITATIALFACLLTAMSLTLISTNFIRQEIFRNKVRYLPCLLLILSITFAMSLLGFSGILNILVPILYVFYPVFIVLTLLNIAHKLWGIEIVKLPVLLVFFLWSGLLFISAAS